MLAAALIWLYSGALCYVYGALFFKRMNVPLTILAGMAVLTVFAEFFSLFFQIGWLLHLILLASAIIIVSTRRVQLPRIRPPSGGIPLLVLVAALLLILENATQRPTNPDTSLYHAQAIRWMETYPAVPGLGNLHGRLAFNSAWLVTNALFSFSFLGLGSFHLSAGLLFLAVTFIFYEGFFALKVGRYQVSALLKTGFLPLGVYVLGGELSSPGTDLPISLFIWLIAILWAEKAEDEQPHHVPLIALLAFFAVTVKLSALPLLLLVLASLTGQKRWLIGIAACGMLVLLPFLVRNVLLSGYLIYPYPSLDLFSFDWKIPFERANTDRSSIISFGRFVGPGDASAPFSVWFPIWLAQQTVNRRIVFFASLLTPLAGIFARFAPRRLWTGWLAMYAGVLFWLFSAPDFRFGYGFLLAALMLALAPWLSMVFQRFSPSPRWASALASLLATVYLLFTLARSFEPGTFASRLLLPAGYDRVAVDACPLANGLAFCARNYGFCSYAELPCAPSPRPWVELRGQSLREGFRSVK